jgi:hypothetical protein
MSNESKPASKPGDTPHSLHAVVRRRQITEKQWMALRQANWLRAVQALFRRAMKHMK